MNLPLKKSATIVFSLFMAMACFADIRLPKLVGSNMVLQQQSTVKIWGWADPMEIVFVTTSWNNKTDSIVTTGDALWKISVQTPAAGGPFTITVKGQNEIILENILIGEVWFCSGQSNMEFGYYKDIKDIIEETPKAYNDHIRFFHIPKTTSLYPQDDCQGEWKICDSNSIKNSSAVGYFFGKKLNKDLNVPIGLIESSWGGTSAEVWTPEEVVSADQALTAAAQQIAETEWWPNKTAYAYNAMIAPVVNYSIAGAIWYQGESNATTASTYSQLFTAMIDAWRRKWDKDFPFYYVQVAPFAYENHNTGALLMEAQMKSRNHKNVGMVVVSDLVNDTNDIHPQNKHDVGYRLANWALAETYHKEGFAYKSPVYKEMNVQKGRAIISFENVLSGLQSKDKKITQLYVAGEDKLFYPAEGKIEKDKLIVWRKGTPDPVAVRYAFGNASIGNLFSKEGLPVTAFRTDDWEVDVSAVKP
ncbi:MAG: sialate O-acetylesterase [Flavitalea sp.]